METYDEINKAYDRFNKIVDRGWDVDRKYNHLNLRTKKMTNPVKLFVWALVLKENRWGMCSNYAREKAVLYGLTSNEMWSIVERMI